MKHKWHKEIKAWADGAIIECQNAATGEWEELEVPYWYESNEYKYRIKSQPKEPQYLYVYGDRYATLTSLEKAESHSGLPLKAKIKLEDNDD